MFLVEGPFVEKLILEIERQIQRLQAAKQLLLDTQESPHIPDDSALLQSFAPPVKRGRGRPRKHPLPPSAQNASA